MLFAVWIRPGSGKVAKRLPGLDNAPSRKELGDTSENVKIGEFFKSYSANKVRISGDHSGWPCFRGSRRDNIVGAPAKLPDDWSVARPKELWSVKLLGEGHAAPAVLNGRVYLLDYDEKIKADVLRCLSLDDGKELWRRWYNIKTKRNHGISRTIPAVTDRFVVSIGPKCQAMCLDSRTGAFKWGIDMARDLGADVPFWYTGQCPLIDDGVAVLAPCGVDVLMMGVDCETGKIVWSVPNEFKWKMSHSSIITADVRGVRTYVYAALGGIVGVSAEKSDKGRVLWHTTEWNFSVVAPSPVYLGNGRFLITSGYGAGGMLFQVGADGTVEVIQKYSPGKGICSEQQTPVCVDGKIYSILPKDAGRLRKRFVCFSVKDCEKPLWSSGVRFGLGPYIFADGKFIILDDGGTLFMVKPGESRMETLGKFQAIPDGDDAWGPLAVAGSRILMRDLTRLFCYDLAPSTLRTSLDREPFPPPRDTQVSINGNQ
ncbi:MAG: PQQ-binding-like beta-propeller repeat protein [Kiritimatiellaeota bacterium]|nr:PQQ-binding-like beta-propeller repeat protein [Kiritimatiellota bacterium]